MNIDSFDTILGVYHVKEKEIGREERKIKNNIDSVRKQKEKLGVRVER